MSELLLSFSDKSLMKNLNSSGDIGWPCSVPQRMSIFSESLIRSLTRAEELLYINAKMPKLKQECLSANSVKCFCIVDKAGV